MRLFPCIFSYLPFDYRAENGMYSYIHRCFTLSTIWKFIFADFLSPRLPCSKTILKKFYQSLNPIRKSNDPLNYLESFPPVCDASNKSLNINFFEAFLLPINQSSIHLVTSVLNHTIFTNIHNTENLEI